MRTNRRQYVPQTPEGRQLESRVVMSAGLRTLAAQQVQRSVEGFRPTRTQPLSVSQKIDAAFTSFRDDYTQARVLYFGTITSPSASGQVSDEAFKNFTSQRVNLLAQELMTAMRSPVGGKQKGADLSAGVASVVNRRINGRAPGASMSVEGAPVQGTLLQALIDSIPEPNPSSAQSTTFYTLAQDSAIDTAHTAMLNAVYNYKSMAARKGK